MFKHKVVYCGGVWWCVARVLVKLYIVGYDGGVADRPRWTEFASRVLVSCQWCGRLIGPTGVSGTGDIGRVHSQLLAVRTGGEVAKAVLLLDDGRLRALARPGGA